MAKDLVIGAVSDYNFDKIETWLNSLQRSGYNGNIALVAYNMSAETVNKLSNRGIQYIFGFERDSAGNFVYNNKAFSIMIERFIHMWYFIKNMQEDTEYVITTDVRDVVFQTNPSTWLRSMTDKKSVFVATENLVYEQEPWGRNNLLNSFGQLMYDHLKDRPIYCAGVIAGKKQAMLDLFLNVFLLSKSAPAHVVGGGGPDQAALNITIGLEQFAKTIGFMCPENDFAIHAGTTLEAIKSGSGDIGATYLRDPSVLETYARNLLFAEPIMKDGLVCNKDGKPYCIVHQYDRVNSWRDLIDRKYR
jgi:hypothetical protein